MSIRTEKVSSLLKAEMSTILHRDIVLETQALVTVTDVVVTPDLRVAKVYLSVYDSGERREIVIKELNRRKGEVRYILGSRVRLKYTPELQFYLDETLDKVDSLERIFKQLKNNDQ